MDSSKVLQNASQCESAVPVHMLMNADRRVVIDTQSGASRQARTHLRALGLNTIGMSTAAHDRFIAQTQLPLFALLPLIDTLEKWRKRGLLTPSAQDLLDVLEKRKREWSPATVASLKAHQLIERSTV